MTQNNAINHTDLILHKTSPSDIDFKTTGVTTIFTTPAGLAFIPIGYGYYGSTITALTVAATFNLGTNAATYDNFANGQSFDLTSSGNCLSQNTFNFSAPETIYIPANTDFKINITVGATATTALARVFIWGFFVPDN